VLDNCEHVIDAVAGLCTGLLATADDVRVLATSREPLRVAGEARYRLGPLTLPDPDNPDDTAGVAGCEAVALFVDRARRVDASFALDAKTMPVVARLVAQLDGMPLAIELATTRVEALGVARLLDRLDTRFALLTGGDRLAPFHGTSDFGSSVAQTGYALYARSLCPADCAQGSGPDPANGLAASGDGRPEPISATGRAGARPAG